MNIDKGELGMLVGENWDRADRVVRAQLRELGVEVGKRVLSPRAHEGFLGSGMWGMVYGTVTPGWVVKFTADETEGPVTSMIINTPALSEHPGASFFGGVWRIKAELSTGDPIFVILREDIKPLADRPSWGAREDILVRIRRSALALNEAIDNGDVAKAVKAGRIWKRQLDELSAQMSTQDLADFMSVFFDAADGVLADVHIGNVGTRAGSRQWIVFDPGVSSINERYHIPWLANPGRPIPLLR